jgi:Flp pilus assembly protein TadG
MASFNGQIHQRKGDPNSGQATIEFALLLPLFVSCVAVLCAVVGIGLTSIRLADTARLTARAASTSETPSDVIESMVQTNGISHSESIDASGQFLTVHLTKKIHIPFLGLPIPKVSVSAQSTVLIESVPVLVNE